MVDVLAAQERAKYETMWSDPAYSERSPGMRVLEDALQRMQMPPGSSVVDFGCGTGRVCHALTLRGYQVTALDIAENAGAEFGGRFMRCCLWDIPPEVGMHDYGFCADVMEHIPPEKVDATISGIAAHARSVYFQIAHFDCAMGNAHGLKLHLTIKPIDWWRAQLEKHFSTVSIEDQGKHFIAVCLSRPSR